MAHSGAMRVKSMEEKNETQRKLWNLARSPRKRQHERTFILKASESPFKHDSK